MKLRIKHELGEIWKDFEGKKVVWKLQAQHGIDTFKTKKMAETWKKAFITNKHE